MEAQHASMGDFVVELTVTYSVSSTVDVDAVFQLALGDTGVVVVSRGPPDGTQLSPALSDPSPPPAAPHQPSPPVGTRMRILQSNAMTSQPSSKQSAASCTPASVSAYVLATFSADASEVNFSHSPVI